MGGSNRSLLNIVAVNIRAAAAPTYYAAHSKNGNNVSQKVVARMAINTPGKQNDGKGTVDYIDMTFWGKMADVAARSIGEGKELSGQLKMKQYKARTFHNTKQVFVAGANGQPEAVMHNTYGFELEPGTLIFGEDGQKQIDREIRETERPVGWNVAGSPGALAWKAALDKRNNMAFNPALKTFGHAKVVLASGPGIGAYDHSKDKPEVAASPGGVIMGTVEQAVIDAVGAALPTAPPVPAAAMVSVQGV